MCCAPRDVSESLLGHATAESPMRTTSILILVGRFLLASVSVAFAHAHLQKAVPPVESTVTQPPTEVAIAFTEAVEPRFSSIEGSGAN